MRLRRDADEGDGGQTSLLTLRHLVTSITFIAQ
jgi:hypothetical protein